MLNLIANECRSVNMAKVVYDSFRHSPWYRKSVLPKSANSSLLKVHKWKASSKKTKRYDNVAMFICIGHAQVTFAATPDDIYWENLSMESRFLLIKKLLINAVLFLILFFLTTPEYIISQTDFLVTTLGSEVFHLPPAIVDFLPTLTLWGVTALLPLLVAWSDRFLGVPANFPEIVQLSPACQYGLSCVQVTGPGRRRTTTS